MNRSKCSVIRKTLLAPFIRQLEISSKDPGKNYELNEVSGIQIIIGPEALKGKNLTKFDSSRVGGRDC